MWNRWGEKKNKLRLLLVISECAFFEVWGSFIVDWPWVSSILNCAVQRCSMDLSAQNPPSILMALDMRCQSDPVNAVTWPICHLMSLGSHDYLWISCPDQTQADLTGPEPMFAPIHISRTSNRSPEWCFWILPARSNLQIHFNVVLQDLGSFVGRVSVCWHRMLRPCFHWAVLSADCLGYAHLECLTCAWRVSFNPIAFNLRVLVWVTISIIIQHSFWCIQVDAIHLNQSQIWG